MKGKNDIKELEVSIDDPLENPAEDCLDRSAFAKRIFEIIEGTPLSTNMTIGIHGAWGSGKTTTMNFLRFYCKEAGHPVALYTPWQFHDKKEAWKGFVSSIDKGIAEWQGKKIGNLKRQAFVKQASEKVRELTAVTTVGKIAGSLILAPSEGLLEQTKLKVQNELNKVLKDKRLFIFIDDLDRAEKRLLFSVNSLFHNENVYNQLRSIAQEVSKNNEIHENFCEYARALFFAATDCLDYTDKEEVIKLLKEKEFMNIIWSAVVSKYLNLRLVGTFEQKRKIIMADLLKDEKAFPVPEWWEKELKDAKDRN